MQKDNKKKLVFKFLNELTDDIVIRKNDAGMVGKVNDEVLFVYMFKERALSVSRQKLSLIINMFNIGDGLASDYIKEYFHKKYEGIHSNPIFGILNPTRL